MSIKLFELGIKPGMLIDCQSFERVKHINCYKYHLKSSRLLSHRPLDLDMVVIEDDCIITNIDNQYLGDVLGYPPSYITNFGVNMCNRVFVNYSGIIFATELSNTQQAIQWCDNMYLQKLSEQNIQRDVYLWRIDDGCIKELPIQRGENYG